LALLEREVKAHVRCPTLNLVAVSSGAAQVRCAANRRRAANGQRSPIRREGERESFVIGTTPLRPRPQASTPRRPPGSIDGFQLGLTTVTVGYEYETDRKRAGPTGRLSVPKDLKFALSTRCCSFGGHSIAPKTTSANAASASP